MLIELKDYSKRLNGITILKNIDLHLESGNIYGLVGHNGSGKTMILRAISGLIHPSYGKVTVDGQELGKKNEFPPSMGIFIEKPVFLPYLTGFENLKYLAEIKHVISEETIMEYMKMFFLDPLEKKPYKKYSQGMKQKIGIIQAMMENPDLIILDEAFNALDEDSVKILRQWLIRARGENKLIVLTSHNKEDISALCDHTYYVDNGKIGDMS